jgi:hypothetical protein
MPDNGIRGFNLQKKASRLLGRPRRVGGGGQSERTITIWENMPKPLSIFDGPTLSRTGSIIFT